MLCKYTSKGYSFSNFIKYVVSCVRHNIIMYFLSLLFIQISTVKRTRNRLNLCLYFKSYKASTSDIISIYLSHQVTLNLNDPVIKLTNHNDNCIKHLIKKNPINILCIYYYKLQPYMKERKNRIFINFLYLKIPSNIDIA